MNPQAAVGQSRGHVWAILRHFAPNFSGTAVQAEQILARLTATGFSADVLTAADHLAADMAGRTVEMDGFRVRYLPVVQRRAWSTLSAMPFAQKTARYLNTLISNLSFTLQTAVVLWREGRRGDIVHLHSFSEFSFAVEWLARVRGMHPVVMMTLLGSDDPAAIKAHGKGGVLGLSKNVLGRLQLEAFHQAEAVVSLCTAQTKSCSSAELDMTRVIQIPCAVDTALFRPSGTDRARQRSELGLPADKRYIVFVGSALYRKGIDLLIRSFTQVAHRISNVDVLIVGPSDFSDQTRHSPEREQLISQLQRELTDAGCASRVHWIGEVKNVHEYLQTADVFCLPTRREGFGIVIAEAMAAGLPVVIARLEGVTTDHITHGREGLLVPEHTADAFAQALLLVLQNPSGAACMGAAARERAASEFEVRIVAQQFARLYEGLAGVAHV